MDVVTGYTAWGAMMGAGAAASAMVPHANELIVEFGGGAQCEWMMASVGGGAVLGAAGGSLIGTVDATVRKLREDHPHHQ